MKNRVVKIKKQCNASEVKIGNYLALMQQSGSMRNPSHKGCIALARNSKIG